MPITSFRSVVILSVTSCRCVFVSFVSTFLLLFVVATPTVLSSSVLRRTQTHFYLCIWLLFLGGFHFTSPVRLNGKLVIRVEMEFDLISLANFNWLKVYYFWTSRINWLRAFRPIKVPFSNDFSFNKSDYPMVFAIALNQSTLPAKQQISPIYYFIFF